MKNLKSLNIALIVCILMLVGCAQTGPRPEDVIAPGEGAGAGADGQNATGLEDGGVEVSPLDDPQSPLAQRVIYFEYDSSEVSPQYNDLIDVHGEYLADHPQQRVRLEGHADERGTREYNLALGEERAQAVRQLLLLQGASADQIIVISYGEERPAAYGHDEQSYAQNRRVELVYLRN